MSFDISYIGKNMDFYEIVFGQSSYLIIFHISMGQYRKQRIVSILLRSMIIICWN